MRAIRAFLLLSALGFAGSAYAEHPGMALPWQLGFQAPVTPVMDRLYELHGWLLVLISIISAFVMGLLGYVCIRFSARHHPTPSKVTHNTLLEIIWTSIPILILVGIAIPSLKIHYFLDRAQNAQMTLKVTGYQWYWAYEYPDQGDISFESHIFPNEQDPSRKVSLEEDRAELKGEPRLLSVDKPAIVPVDTVVRVLVTGADVIHSWSIPAFGVKMDAVPGRINETWFKAEELGTFRGQCSQLCGIWHGFMPIVIKVVSKEDFNAWVAQNKPAPEQPATKGAPVQEGNQPKVKSPETPTAKQPTGKGKQVKQKQ